MIFVIESYLKNRKSKIAAWEDRRRAWASAGQYRRLHEYESVEPYPGIRWSKVLNVVGPVLLIGLVVISCIAFIVTRPPKKVDPNNPHDCSPMVKKDDKVAVQQGDFDGSEGTVIQQKDDCSVDLRLTKSSYTMDICKKRNSGYSCTDTKENETILHVDRDYQVIKL